MDPSVNLKIAKEHNYDDMYQAQYNCTVDPSVKLVLEWDNDNQNKVIKWCNGYGLKWKLDWGGLPRGLDS